MYRKFWACLRPAARAACLVRPPAWAGRLVRAGLAGVLAVPVVTVAALGTASPAVALGNGLALTPPMGFNDWNAYGCNVSEQLVEQTALAMHNDGMQAAGYQYVNIDDCWMASSRDSAGNLVANAS
jgi:alpha-galactosidase